MLSLIVYAEATVEAACSGVRRVRCGFSMSWLIWLHGDWSVSRPMQVDFLLVLTVVTHPALEFLQTAFFSVDVVQLRLF